MSKGIGAPITMDQGWGSVVEWRGGGPSLLRRPRPRPRRPLADRELIERRRAVPTASCECEGFHPSSWRDGATKGASAQSGNGEGTRALLGEVVVQTPLGCQRTIHMMCSPLVIAHRLCVISLNSCTDFLHGSIVCHRVVGRIFLGEI